MTRHTIGPVFVRSRANPLLYPIGYSQSSPDPATFKWLCHQGARRGKLRLYGKTRVSNASNSWGLTPAELRKLRGLKTPYGIQRLLDDMPYHLEDSAWSPRRVLREHTSHCYEGALFAAAALRVIGYPPLLLDLEAEHATDHVLAIYKVDGHWGAVAKSNFTGCRYREPVYRSLRELALSYFNLYFNLRGERTLRTFSQPVQMKRFDSLNWMSSEKPADNH